MKTEPAGICMWCGTHTCLIYETNSKGINNLNYYPEITKCDDYTDCEELIQEFPWDKE